MSSTDMSGKMDGYYSLGIFIYTSYALVYHAMIAILVYNWDSVYALIFAFSFTLTPLILWLESIEIGVEVYGNTLFKQPLFILLLF